MKRYLHLSWPLLVGALSLAATGWLWSHERQTQQRHLRDQFDFSLRQTAVRIEQRMTSYEQILRGVRGLFEASDRVTRERFADLCRRAARRRRFRRAAVDRLRAADQRRRRRCPRAGRRSRPPATADESAAPVTFVAPDPGRSAGALRDDALANPARRVAMLQARDSGGVAITEMIRPAGGRVEPGSDLLMFMPLYAKGQAIDTVAARRAHLTGWVFASFRVGDLMSSLYGEGTPGLDVRVYDGVEIDDATPMYPAAAGPLPPARFEAQEYIGFAGHAWTLLVRSLPEFERATATRRRGSSRSAAPV